MNTSLLIPSRYRGPLTSGNGGYTAGRLAAHVHAEAVEVTLRLPPPLETPLSVLRSDGAATLLHRGETVAEARSATLELELPDPVGRDVAEDASSRYRGFEEHPFPECFTCGPARERGDGLRIFAGAVAGSDGLVAAPWTAVHEDSAVVWAAIDCPGAFAVGAAARGETVLGRMTASVWRVPDDGERCVVMGWPLGEDGRKLFAGTALFGEDGEALAAARQVWIVPRPALSGA